MQKKGYWVEPLNVLCRKLLNRENKHMHVS